MMKTNFWLILGAMIAASAIAQDTNALPPIPAPLTSPAAEVAPAAKPAKKKIVATRKLIEPVVTLAPGAAEVAVSNLNVRGQAGLKGEFIAHITKGNTVTVLDQINISKHAANEPAQWAKIALPASVKVWVRAQFIDATNKVVLPKKLNLRAGPSEDYSVLGVIERGTPVSEVITKGEWMQIEAPTNAYAFVAAMYLKQAASGTLAVNLAPSAETEVPVVANPAPEPQPVVAEPTNAAPPVDTNAPAPAAIETNLPANPPAPIVVDTNLPPPPPRKVSHEGTVRHVVSPVAPTDYELYDPATGKNVDYLFTTSETLDLSTYNGLRVVVTGTEGLDERWKDTPVITIERIQVVQ
jgi:uncharacterized protein YgiM (DUF1202 family)